MEEEKDMQQGAVSNPENRLVSKEIFDSTSHSSLLKTILRAEKLVTALYMVTDCIEGDDPMKMKLRDRGVHLLSHLHAIMVSSAGKMHTGCTSCMAIVKEIQSFLSITSSLGFISEMNYSILRREFEVLDKKLSEKKENLDTLGQGGDGALHRRQFQSFSIPKNLLSDLENLDTDLENIEHELSDTSHKQSHMSSYKGHLKDIQKDKKTEKVKDKKMSQALKVGLRITRRDAILKVIKDKGQVSIKDITDFVTGCSAKTIQRELNTLTKEGRVRKVGKKRWARYELNT